MIVESKFAANRGVIAIPCERQYGTEADQHQPTMAKFGALLAAGILDAGGRNMCVALTSRSGFLRMGAVVGLCVWCHHWYWHPLLHFFSLTLAPTAVIGVNKELKIPGSFKLKCDAKPSLFAYPEPLEEKKEEKLRLNYQKLVSQIP